MAAAILLGIPILPLWGNAAYTDIAWALFQFLAVMLIIVWAGSEDSKLLFLAGILQGLALSTKYSAVSGMGVLIVIILYTQWKSDLTPGKWKRVLVNVLIFPGRPSLPLPPGISRI